MSVTRSMLQALARKNVAAGGITITFVAGDTDQGGGTTRTSDLPTGAASGDLLIAVHVNDSGSGSLTWHGDWTEIGQHQGNTMTVGVAYLDYSTGSSWAHTVPNASGVLYTLAFRKSSGSWVTTWTTAMESIEQLSGGRTDAPISTANGHALTSIANDGMVFCTGDDGGDLIDSVDHSMTQFNEVSQGTMSAAIYYELDLSAATQERNNTYGVSDEKTIAAVIVRAE